MMPTLLSRPWSRTTLAWTTLLLAAALNGCGGGESTSSKTDTAQTDTAQTDTASSDGTASDATVSDGGGGGDSSDLTDTAQPDTAVQGDTGGGPDTTGTGGNPAVGANALSVFVESIEGNVVANAKVMAGSKELTTNKHGLALFEGLPTGELVVRATAPGFAEASAKVTISADAGVSKTLVLAKVAGKATVGPGQPITANANGVSVEIEAGALVFLDGGPVTGTIEVEFSVAKLDDGPIAGAPGAMVSDKGEALVTAAMADISFRSEGKPLKLKDGATGKVTMQLKGASAASFADGAPIASYFYDVAAAAWKSGPAGKVSGSGGGASATFAANHFTWWMLGGTITQPGCVDVTVTVGGKPAAGAEVGVAGVSYAAFAAGQTDATGKVCVGGQGGGEALVLVSAANAKADSKTVTVGAGACGAGGCSSAIIDLAPLAGSGDPNVCGAVLDCFGPCLEGGKTLGQCKGQCGAALDATQGALLDAIISCLVAACGDAGTISCVGGAIGTTCKAPFDACEATGGMSGGCSSDSQCKTDNPCFEGVCVSGECKSSPIDSPSCNGGGGGCQNDSQCPPSNDPCFKNACQNGQCMPAPTGAQGCNGGGGCQTDSQCPPMNDPCYVMTCQVGQCMPKPTGASGCGGSSECQNDGQCPFPVDPCKKPFCNAGKCEQIPTGDPMCGGAGGCQNDAQCKVPVDPCKKAVCQLGACQEVPTGDPNCGGGGCTEAVQCEDANPCTTDLCEAGSCKHTPIDGCGGGPKSCTSNAQCDDGNPCTVDICGGGSCMPSMPDDSKPACKANCFNDSACDDGKACTKESCDLKTKQCKFELTSACGVMGCAAAYDCVDTCVQGGKDVAQCTAGCTPDDPVEKATFDALASCIAAACTNSSCFATTVAQTCAAKFAACMPSCNAPADCEGKGGACKNASCAQGKCSFTAKFSGQCQTCNSTADCGSVFYSKQCQQIACEVGECKVKALSPTPSGCPQACTVKTDCDAWANANPCFGSIECKDAGQGVSYCQGLVKNPGDACDDGNACTAIGKCTSSGECEGQTAKTCDDNKLCTVDSCDSKTANCVFAPIAEGGACNDGDVCTESDVCTKSVCAGKPKVCNDDNVCTDDSCMSENAIGCAYIENAAGFACDDGNDCTDMSCDKVKGCINTIGQDGTYCSDGNICTGIKDNIGDSCKAGVCIAGPITDCEDGNACTDEACNPANGNCVKTNNAKPCDDGSLCTGPDACAGGACKSVAKDCDDKNPCTDDSCNQADGACKNVPNDAGTCTDGDVCTDDVCKAGKCTTSQNTAPCTGSDPCKTYACAAGTCGVAGNAADGTKCEDGEPCTDGDTCATGACKAGGPKSCTDNNDCTSETCQNGVGCVYTPKSNATYCDKGCDFGNQQQFPGCKDCGGYGCYKELLGAHYCGNPAGSDKGKCMP